MAYGLVNADNIADSNGGVLAPISSVMRNRIINGQMTIDQRNAGASFTPTTTNGYCLDRWKAVISQNSKLTTQQSTTAPVGFTNSLLVTSSSAYSVASGDYFLLTQFIEGFNASDLGWGTVNAKTVTLSFQVYSSLTGTFGGSLSNNAENRSYPFSYTVSSANTWTTVSVTIAGDTTGTWLTNNGRGIEVNFGLGCGSTYSGTAGSWAGAWYGQPTSTVSVVGTSGATWYVTGVQLERGSSATGFEYRQYGQELALCQRYYETSYDIGVAPGTAITTGQWVGTIAPAQTTALFGNNSFKTTKRTSPTIVVYANNGTSGSVTFPSISSGVAISSITTPLQAGFPQINFGSGQTAGSIGNCSWTASAEL